MAQHIQPMFRAGAFMMVVVTSLAIACDAHAAGSAVAGRELARTYCAECHSLDARPSPLADAPPFWSLYRRVPAGGRLEDLLSGGMIAPTPSMDGQTPPLHPRMPQARLDDDQIADLVAFLRSAQRPPSLRP